MYTLVSPISPPKSYSANYSGHLVTVKFWDALNESDPDSLIYARLCPATNVNGFEAATALYR